MLELLNFQKTADSLELRDMFSLYSWLQLPQIEVEIKIHNQIFFPTNKGHERIKDQLNYLVLELNKLCHRVILGLFRNIRAT